MINVITRYFSFNRFILRTIGLWPYKQSRLVRLQFILLQSILMSLIIFQFMVFATSTCSMQIIIEVCSTAFFYIFCAIKYNSYLFNMDIRKYLLELLQHTYNELRNENEIAIMDKYWNIGRFYTKLITLLMLIDIFSCISFPYLLHILDAVLLINVSLSYRSMYIITEYFIDQEKYFYLIMLHINVATCIGKLVVLAVSTMNIIYLYHSCGMFMIVSYRIEHFMMPINLQTNNNKQKNVNIGIIHAVDIHCNAMRLVQILMSSIDMPFFFIIGSGVISASLNLFRVTNELLSGCDFEKLLVPADILIFLTIYFFIANINAQHIADHSKDVFTTVYNVEWYMAPVYTQKLILFILQRGSKAFNIVIGKLFVGSLQGFATLMSASISYFTVMYSTR